MHIFIIKIGSCISLSIGWKQWFNLSLEFYFFYYSPCRQNHDRLFSFGSDTLYNNVKLMNSWDWIKTNNICLQWVKFCLTSSSAWGISLSKLVVTLRIFEISVPVESRWIKVCKNWSLSYPQWKLYYPKEKFYFTFRIRLNNYIEIEI